MVRYSLLFIFALVGLASGSLVSGASLLTPLSLALLLIGSLLLWRREGSSFRGLGFHPSSRWPLQLLGAMAIGAGIVALFSLTLAWSGALSLAARDGLDERLPQLLLQVFILTALVAVSEELIFRGVYFQKLRLSFHFWIGVIGSTALWALIHLPAMAGDGVPLGGILLGLLTFLGFGVFLSLAMVIAGGSLWVPIGIHYGYNLAFSALGAFYSVEIVGQPIITGYPGWAPETGAVGALVWLGLAFLLGIRGGALIQTGRAESRPGVSEEL